MKTIWLKSLRFLCSFILVSSIALAERTEDQAAETYLEVLGNLQNVRVGLVRHAHRLMFADQNLRDNVMKAEISAARNAQIAVSTPQYSFALIGGSKGSKSKKSSEDRSKSRECPEDNGAKYLAISNSSYKNSMAFAARLWKMQSMIEQTKLRQTHVVFSGVMKALKANLLNFCQMADMYGTLSKAESERAAELMEQILKDDPANVGAMLVRAAAARNLGDFATAERLAVDIQRFPTVAASLGATVSAQCRIMQMDFDAAHKLLAAAIKHTKGSSVENPLVVRANLYAIEGDFKNALADAKHAVSRNKLSPQAFAIQALIECQSTGKLQKLEKAVEHSEAALALSKDRTGQILEIAALATSQSGEFTAAQKIMSEATVKSFGARKSRLEKSLVAIENQTSPQFDWTGYTNATWAAFR